MRTIYEAKELIKSNINKHVSIKVFGIRNKNDLVEGVISECYPNIFMVSTNSGKKSFSYSDVLIGNIMVKIK
ncbi:MAG: Veg family protein [Bacilli bacterium]|nr:Veg family protein [Bacilli bacterium]